MSNAKQTRGGKRGAAPFIEREEPEDHEDQPFHGNGRPFHGSTPRSQRGDGPDPIKVAMRLARQITEQFPDREQPDELKELLVQLNGMEPGQCTAAHQRLCAAIIENDRDEEHGYGKVQPAYAVARALEADGRTNVTRDGEHRRYFLGDVRVAGWLQDQIQDDSTPLEWEDLFFLGLAERIPETEYARYFPKDYRLTEAPAKLKEALEDPEILALSSSRTPEEQREHLLKVEPWLIQALAKRAEMAAKIRQSNQAKKETQQRLDQRRSFLSRLPAKPREQATEAAPPAIAPLDDEVGGPTPEATATTEA